MDIAQILLVISGIFLAVRVGAEDKVSPLTYRIIPDSHGGQFSVIQDSNYVESHNIERKFLKKYMLSPDVTCNDGSPAGFYMRHSNYSKTWIVFLEEGWCCYDKQSCDERWSRAEYLMSSKEWPETRIIGGILSNNAVENPYWWQANHVFVPYCTSDIWTGRRAKPQHGSKFNFMGSIVIKQVIRELLTMGLANADSLILSGSSAGGVGVMLNLDPIQKMLRRYSSMSVHGITDSGWFVDHRPFHLDSDESTSASPIEAVKLGIPYWHSQIPSRCRNFYANEPSKCFIGYKIYPTLSAPLFVFQWLYDNFQLKNDIGTPVTKQQWDYIHKVGECLRKSLMNVTAVFAPSCVSHTVLTNRDWKNIKIDSISLPLALHCWHTETKLAKTSQNPKSRKIDNSNKKIAKVEKNSGQELKKTQKIRRKNNNQRTRVTNEEERMYRKRRRHHKNRAGCRHQHIERCTWPQCNNSCPKLQNPATGEEVDFIELLQSFGVDIPKLSSELGIDMESLIHMDQEELLNLLTQQSN
ncbi:palmitoleoyl-protein carboxylesterase NOTUM isoform X3 [Daktulosphaira vitifoliae]|uniref:palmitoleoyl-protein carboxylesterase NOTUM isoform X3 n=1 Tax=Daktulosphaira vitifoliae TaxID=58002 RepID=UPI0021A9CB3C|nr:palmitoleoyl-protein carboxylesterase NOTUM isoform X3 [Daktulosphaira vitifoliae]